MIPQESQNNGIHAGVRFSEDTHHGQELNLKWALEHK